MSREPISGLNAMSRHRLPLNRKERYFTGTVLPMIVASDGFTHLDRFLELCRAPSVGVVSDPVATNIQFFSEYGFKESLVDGAEKRFRAPGGKDTPDLVIYIESDTCVLIGVEAKVFHRPPRGDLERQLAVQAELLSVMADGLGTNPTVLQVALLPAGLGAPDRIGDVPVVTWEKIADAYREIAPPYWLGVLDEALGRYDRLVSQSNGGRNFQSNSDATVSGGQIVDLWESGDRTFMWMGRAQGIRGGRIRGDLASGEWRTHSYQVRHDPLPGKSNWFPIESFVKLVQQPRSDHHKPSAPKPAITPKPSGSASSGRNADAKITGQEIYDRYKVGDTEYVYMGRNRGREGPELLEDLRTGSWRTRPYQVSRNRIRNRNWFQILSFVKAIDLRAEAHADVDNRNS